MDTTTLKQNITGNFSKGAQATFLSTYDQLKIEGKIEGKVAFVSNNVVD